MTRPTDPRPLRVMCGAGPTALHLPFSATPRVIAHASVLAERTAFRARIAVAVEAGFGAAHIAAICSWGATAAERDRASRLWLTGVWVPVDRQAFEAFLALATR